MSRRAPRYRIDIAAKAQPLLGGETAVCRTRDVSEVGLCLDTAAWFPLGTRISVSLFEPNSGTALEVIGDVVREAVSPSWSLGIILIEPPEEWGVIVAAAARSSLPPEKKGKRLRVLVVGDGHRQRGAMALYVTSGWDVLFASDDDSIAEVIDHKIELDAVIAELDVSDPRIYPIMEGIRKSQPTARRIVRTTGKGAHELVHRFVERDDGLEALLDAISADIPAAVP
ncbi:MAG: PilZ domain-containing protein [Deltaproteobacteria bacterium]|nr:PilZ domain-containing protein [Deltaproteobacteria bacterium]